MRTSVFVGASVDGFIAREDGGLDFLDAGGNEAHGYEEFIATIDTLVMGRKTFETVLGFGVWPYGERRVAVLSHRPVDLTPVAKLGGRAEWMKGMPAEISSRLEAQGAQHVYLDGGITIQGFLAAGLVQRLVVSRVPILIGRGIPLFGTLPHDVRLRHVGTKAFGGGLVQSEYEVVNEPA